jgi:molybdopterin-guanine dinucleotide biosynthesis protein A
MTPGGVPAITGVILAGGRGQRMGGVDKGLIRLNGQALVSHVAARLAPQVAELLINANQNGATYAALGYRVIGDCIGGFAGPLAGLHAALAGARHRLVATAPCDSPFLPADLVSRLWSALTASRANIAIARAGGRIHPVFCLCERTLLLPLSDFLARGERQFGRFCATQKCVEVAFDDLSAAFENINTRADLERLERPPPAS